MCRFLAYLGTPIVIDELLIKPVNSLINQSYDAEEMTEPLNGDGFGLGWYNKAVHPYPGLFCSITPAWSNNNLLYNAKLMQTECLFAHVRAASEGGISEYNCHPFHYKEYLMMHNGEVKEFTRIKRALHALLSDKFFHWIKGQTDSEHVFALLMQILDAKKIKDQPLTSAEVANAFQQTFDTVKQLKRDAGIGDAFSSYNMMITDGLRIFGTRYSTDPEEMTPTLYYSMGAHFASENGISRMIKAGRAGEKAVLIVSEKLTEVEEDWIPIPANSFIAVDEDRDVELMPLS